MKHNANRAVVEGKRIVLIDNSIVRGTTSIKIMQMMREAGAREVHLRISSPPIAYPDFYGIDTPERDQAARGPHGPRGDGRFVGADLSPSSPSREPIAPWAIPAATPGSRNSPTIASPATIPPVSSTGSEIRDASNCPFWPRRADGVARRLDQRIAIVRDISGSRPSKPPIPALRTVAHR